MLVHRHNVVRDLQGFISRHDLVTAVIWGIGLGTAVDGVLWSMAQLMYL